MKTLINEKSEYDIQAEEFLTDTKTEFKIRFIKNDLYFDDDREKRDIYEVTLKRREREFKFKFGQSINCSGEYTFIHKDGKRERIILLRNINDKPILRFNGVNLDKGNSIKNAEFKTPSAYDVLSCLGKYEPEEFKDFCSEYGYNDDSIKALKIYEAVKNEYNNLKMLYSDAEIETLREIE